MPGDEEGVSHDLTCECCGVSAPDVKLTATGMNWRNLCTACKPKRKEG